MSDNQNPIVEEITEVVTSEVSPEISEVEPTTSPAPSEEKSSRPSRPEGRGDRPQGDRPRGPRRDGMREEEKEFKEEMLSIDRVTRVTAGGRQIRFRASIVIGDGKGRIGLGTGKAGEVQVAIEKAIRDAKKHLITFPIVNGTIPHDVSVKYKASGLYIHPAHPGTGIIAGGAVRKIFAVSGIKDVIAKQHGAPNDITNARVTLKALASLKPITLNNAFTKKKVSTEMKEEKIVEKKTPVAKIESAPKAPAKKAPTKKKAE
jgi:small subunit ribosomal protein S5